MRPPSDMPRAPRTPRGGFRPRSARRSRVVASAILGAIVAVFVSARSVSNFYVDVLWFDALGRTDVFWGVLGAKVLLAAVFTLAAAAFVWTYLAGQVAALVLVDNSVGEEPPPRGGGRSSDLRIAGAA